MRLIDADELCRAIKIKANPYGKPTLDFETACAILDMIADAPTIDAVYVVRCKDCKYRQGNICDYSAVWTRPNGFCQWGEKKDDAPTANSVKHGHWEVLHHFEYRCSQCGEHWNTENGVRIEDLRYCPRCGARMEAKWQNQ